MDVEYLIEYVNIVNVVGIIRDIFFNYIKFFSVFLMATCDSYLRFTWTNVGDNGVYITYNKTNLFKSITLNYYRNKVFFRFIK